MQKNRFLLLFAANLLFCLHLALAQTGFSTIDERARQVPFPKGQNINQLAGELTAGLKTEKEKARAIFVWITENIRYDIKTLTDDNAEASEVMDKQEPVVVLRSKKAICAGYSNLFQALCSAAGIKAIKVEGLSKNNYGRISRIGHAWNLARLDGEWGLIDATWGAGGIDEDKKTFTQHFNEQFFLGKPEGFMVTHYPSDPLFQLDSLPLDLATFRLKPEEREAVKKPAAVVFPNLKDSLAAFVALDSMARRLDSWSRRLRFDPQDGEASFLLAQYYYNTAVDHFNAFNLEWNRLAQNRLHPTAANLDDFAKTLDIVRTKLDSAHQTVSQVPSGHKFFRMASAMRREVESKQKLCAQAQKQNDDRRAHIKK